jgi:Tfp pilus assembly protein PilO
MTDTRKWSAVAAVLVVAIFAAGWFLLISPKRGDAATLREQAASKAQANSRLEEQIKMLQQQQRDLPKQQATLASLRTKIPTNPALPALIRDLTAAGKKAGVSLDSMEPSPPVAVVSAATTPVVTTTGSSTEADGGSTSTDSASSTAKGKAPAHAAAPTETLFQVPVTLNVTGSYFELEQFISKLENIRRSFLVSGFTIADATAEGTVDGDLTVVLNGRVFLSQAVQPTTTAPVAAPATSTAK